MKLYENYGLFSMKASDPYEADHIQCLMMGPNMFTWGLHNVACPTLGEALTDKDCLLTDDAFLEFSDLKLRVACNGVDFIRRIM